jgi:hypothetical protein
LLETGGVAPLFAQVKRMMRPMESVEYIECRRLLFWLNRIITSFMLNAFWRMDKLEKLVMNVLPRLRHILGPDADAMLRQLKVEPHLLPVD